MRGSLNLRARTTTQHFNVHIFWCFRRVWSARRPSSRFLRFSSHTHTRISYNAKLLNDIMMWSRSVLKRRYFRRVWPSRDLFKNAMTMQCIRLFTIHIYILCINLSIRCSYWYKCPPAGILYFYVENYGVYDKTKN